MNELAKIKNWYRGLFLFGYLGLLTYSSFHYHTIDLSSVQTVHEQTDNSQKSPAGDSFNPSAFTCQFNLVYNTLHLFISHNNQLNDIKDKPEVIQLKNDDQQPRESDYFQIRLRAPPAFS